jgi:hypothetical protein
MLALGAWLWLAFGGLFGLKLALCKNYTADYKGLLGFGLALGGADSKGLLGFGKSVGFNELLITKGLV